MEKYDYLGSVKEDVQSYIENEIDTTDYEDKDELFEDLSERLLNEDSVTGNGSGSYTFNSYQAEENLCHNLDLLEDASNEWGEDLGELVKRGAEVCDVTIRCYLLHTAIEEVLDENDYQYGKDEDEEEENDEEEKE
jgi:hypothetical protein